MDLRENYYTFKFNPKDIKEEEDDIESESLSITFYNDGELVITERVIHVKIPEEKIEDNYCLCTIL